MRITKPLEWSSVEDPENELDLKDTVLVAFPFGITMGGFSILEDTNDTFYIKAWGVVYARHKTLDECKEVANEHFDAIIKGVLI